MDVLRGHPSPTGGLARPDAPEVAASRVVPQRVPCVFFCFASRAYKQQRVHTLRLAVVLPKKTPVLLQENEQ